MKLRVMGPVYSSKKKLAVYITDKANGENCQISYNKQYQYWIVGSKNVTVAIKDMESINWYKAHPQTKDDEKNNRFEYALEFAIEWLNILQNKIKDKVEEFKAELGDYTLIGESVGDLRHQH